MEFAAGFVLTRQTSGISSLADGVIALVTVFLSLRLDTDLGRLAWWGGFA